MKLVDREFFYLPSPRRIRAYERLLEFLKYEVRVGNKLLDGGCAGGKFVKMALDCGFHADGFEPSPGGVAYAREHFGLELIKADVMHIPIPDNNYDVVTLLHVFEHFRDPIGALNEVKRVLKPGGMLLIETVNYLTYFLFERYLKILKPLYLRIKSKRTPRWQNMLPWFPFDHYYHWTLQTILEILRRVGFEQPKLHIPENYSSVMPAEDRLSPLKTLQVKAIRSLFNASGQKLNLWSLLLATAQKPDDIRKSRHGND